MDVTVDSQAALELSGGSGTSWFCQNAPAPKPGAFWQNHERNNRDAFCKHWLLLIGLRQTKSVLEPPAHTLPQSHGRTPALTWGSLVLFFRGSWDRGYDEAWRGVHPSFSSPLFELPLILISNKKGMYGMYGMYGCVHVCEISGATPESLNFLSTGLILYIKVKVC